MQKQWNTKTGTMTKNVDKKKTSCLCRKCGKSISYLDLIKHLSTCYKVNLTAYKKNDRLTLADSDTGASV
jgi:hypothetical protein